MTPGYLSVQTHDAYFERIRLIVTDRPPSTGAGEQAGPHVRYTARFNDSEAALMHAHEILKRHLLDPDAHLYRVGLAHAIAAIESVHLRRTPVYMDPQIDADTRANIVHLIDANRIVRRRKDSFFQTLGYIGIAILLFNLFVLSSA